MPGPTGINMPNTQGLFPQAQTNPGGGWFQNTAGNIPMDNTNVWSSILSLLPGPAGMAGSALGAYQPLADTASGAQSQTQSLSGLFGGGLGGLGGDFINWLTGQFTGDSSGPNVGAAGKGPAPDFMSSNFGGLGRTLSGLFGGMTPPSGPASGYGTGSLAGLPSAGPNQGFGVPPLMSSQNATWNGLPQAPGQQGFGVPPTMASMNPGPASFGGGFNNPGQSSLYSAGPTSSGFSLGGLGSPNVLPGSMGGI